MSALCIALAAPLLVYVLCSQFGLPQRPAKEPPARLVKKGQGR